MWVTDSGSSLIVRVNLISKWKCAPSSSNEHVGTVSQEEVEVYANLSIEKYALHSDSMVKQEMDARKRKTVNSGTPHCAMHHWIVENVSMNDVGSGILRGQLENRETEWMKVTIWSIIKILKLKEIDPIPSIMHDYSTASTQIHQWLTIKDSQWISNKAQQ